MSVTIGVLSIQGDFKEHIETLVGLDCVVRPVKTVAAVEACDGTHHPRRRARPSASYATVSGSATRSGASTPPASHLGTCAGMILLAKEICESDQWRLEPDGHRGQAQRLRAPGGQLRDGPAGGGHRQWPGAGRLHPRPLRDEGLGRRPGAGDLSRTRSSWPDRGTLLASAFHPEMTNDRRVQEYFLGMVKEQRGGGAGRL